LVRRSISMEEVVRREKIGGRMILNLPGSNSRAVVRRLNWKQQIKHNIYMQNKAAMR
jgi:hypothetical protein